MKHLILTFATLGIMICSVSAQIRFSYDNQDNQSYTFKMRIGNERRAHTFEAVTQKEVTIETTESTIYIASKCPEVPVKNGTRLEIAEGCLRIKKKGK